VGGKGSGRLLSRVDADCELLMCSPYDAFLWFAFFLYFNLFSSACTYPLLLSDVFFCSDLHVVLYLYAPYHNDGFVFVCVVCDLLDVSWPWDSEVL